MPRGIFDREFAPHRNIDDRTSKMPPTPSAKRSRQRKQLQQEQTRPTTLKTGDVVTASDNHYSSWPAVIIDSDQIPPYVTDAKPLAGFHYCVRFMREGKYGWVAAENVQVLSKEEAEAWLKQHAKKDERYAAFRTAINPAGWVEGIFELTKRQVEMVEMPAEATNDSGRNEKHRKRTKGVGLTWAEEEKPQVIVIDLTDESDDIPGTEPRAEANRSKQKQTVLGANRNEFPADTEMEGINDERIDIPGCYSWISPNNPAAPSTQTNTSVRDARAPQEIPEELILNAAFLEYKAALMRKQRAIDECNRTEQKLNSIIGKVDRFIAAGKVECMHLDDNLEPESFILDHLEGRKREIEEEKKRLERGPSVRGTGSTTSPSKRPKTNHGSFNGNSTSTRGHHASYSL